MAAVKSLLTFAHTVGFTRFNAAPLIKLKRAPRRLARKAHLGGRGATHDPARAPRPRPDPAAGRLLRRAPRGRCLEHQAVSVVERFDDLDSRMLVASELFRKQGSPRRQRFGPHIRVLVLQEIEDVESKIAPVAAMERPEIGQAVLADRDQLAVENDRRRRQGLQRRRNGGEPSGAIEAPARQQSDLAPGLVGLQAPAVQLWLMEPCVALGTASFATAMAGGMKRKSLMANLQPLSAIEDPFRRLFRLGATDRAFCASTGIPSSWCSRCGRRS